MTKINILVLPIGKNVLEIRLNGIRMLQSYANIVAINMNDMYYVSDVDYSTTTQKHVSNWLGSTVRPVEIKPQEFFDSINVV
jgi:hypothetical protein